MVLGFMVLGIRGFRVYCRVLGLFRDLRFGRFGILSGKAYWVSSFKA